MTDGILPYIAMLAAPVGAAQTVRARRDAPSRRNSVASLVSCVSSPFEPPYEYGRIDSPPQRVARLAQPLGDQRQRVVPRHALEAGQPFRALADGRIEQPIRRRRRARGNARTLAQM